MAGVKATRAIDRTVRWQQQPVSQIVGPIPATTYVPPVTTANITYPIIGAGYNPT